MKCPTCGYDTLHQGASQCPICGTVLQGGAGPSAPALAMRGADSSAAQRTQVFAMTLQTYGTSPKAKTLDRLPSLNSPTFGREKQLERITNALRTHEMVLLYGPAGAGKSDLAAEAASRLRHAFKRVLWISEVGAAPVATICDTVAIHLGNQEIPKLAPREKCAPTRALLASHDLLLILNDLLSPVTTAALIELCIPADMAVLATSRYAHAAFDLMIEIERLERTAAVDLFCERAKLPPGDDRVGQVCDVLENDPLALVLAAGCVRGDAALLPDLPARLNAEKARLRAQEAGTDADQHRTARTSLNVRSALHVACAALSERHRWVFDALVACFGESTSLELLADICGQQQADCADIAAELVERSLAERDADRYSLQPLVRDLGRDTLDAGLPFMQSQVLQGVLAYAARYSKLTVSDQDKLRAELSNLVRAAHYANASARWSATITLAEQLRDVLDIPICWDELVNIGQLGIQAAEALSDQQALARLLYMTAIALGKRRSDAQARQLLERSVVLKEQIGDQPGVAQIKYQLGAIAQHQGQYDSACRFFEHSKQINQELGNQLGVADCLHQQGLIHQKQHNYHQAITVVKQALKVRRTILGDQHPEFAQTLNDLAELYRLVGKYTSAERRLLQAFAIYSKTIGEKHPDIADCLTNLGRLYYAMGRYGESEQHYRRALDIRRAVLGEQHPYVAQSWNNLAALYYAIGDYDKAQAYLLQATEIYRKTLGENHPDVASGLNNLAGLHYAIGNYAAAVPLYRRALDIRRDVLGGQHPDTAQSLNNLALVYEALGDYAEAQPLLQQALKIRQDTLGPQHVAVAQSLNNLALLHEALGNYDTAKEFCRQALDIRCVALHAQHPDIAQSLNNLAELYRLTGEPEKAQPLYQKALQIYRDALGPQHLYVAQTLTGLADLYEALNDRAAAEACYQEALAIRRKALGADHPDVASSAISLAELYEALDNYAAAEPLYQEALAIRRKALGADHPDVASSAISLAELYEALGKIALVEPLYQEALQIYRAALGEEHTYVAHVLGKLSDVARSQRRYDAARDWLRRGLEIKEKLGDKIGVACNLYRIGRIHQDQGDQASARREYEQSLAIYRELADKTGIIRSLHRLGIVAQIQGQLAEARRCYEQSLQYAQELCLRHKVASNQFQLGRLAQQQGDDDQARRYYQESVTIFDLLQDPEAAAVRRHLSQLL